MASHYPDLPPEQREGTADPDGDGVPNALECLMGTDPLTDQVADGHLPLGGCIEEGGQKFFVLEFSVEEGLAVQLAWGLEQSTTLQPESWVVVPEGGVQQTGDLVTVKLPLFETARRLFRLTVHTP